MTKKEITELFSVMMLAWPRAEMFQGGIAKLGPTITLWTQCLEDVDYWTGQQAVLRLCRTCTFPPTIAEFRAAADAVTQEVETRAEAVFSAIRTGELMYETTDAYYASLPPGHEAKTVIDLMGGTQSLVWKVADGYAWNRDRILTAAREVIRNNAKLPGGKAALPGEKG